MNWAAHIWCWPTPAVKIVSGPLIAPMRLITCCGASDAVVRLGVAQRVGLAPARRPRATRRRSRRPGPRRARWPARPTSSRMTSRASPTIGTSATRFLPISAGSMSACIDLGVRREGGQLAGHPVVEPGAEADDQVAALQRGDRGDGAVHARHAEVGRVAVRQRAAGHQRGDDRDVRLVDQPAQLGAGRGPDDAAADVQHRAAGLGDQPGGLAHLLAVRAGHRPVAGQVDPLRPAEVRHGLQGVLADVDQHRARAAGAGDVERLGDGLRDLVRVGHQVVVLGDRHRDAADVGLLEGVRADRGRTRPGR